MMGVLASNTTQTATASAVLFYMCAALVVGSAFWVVVSRNIVRTALALLLTLVGVGGLYFCLHAEFIAAVQLVVYVGGTLILIVFGVMLTSPSTAKLYTPRRLEVVVGTGIGLLLLASLVTAIRRSSLSGTGSETAGGSYAVGKLGEALLGDYLAPFEIVSVLLLAVMIGAAYLAKARRKGEGN
jgi:NADH-quinone oxidoreductase subunit J